MADQVVNAHPDWRQLVFSQDGPIQQRDGDGVEIRRTSKGDGDLIDAAIFGQGVQYGKPFACS